MFKMISDLFATLFGKHITHIIYAKGADVDLDQLREKVEASFNDPDYAVILNHEIVWTF